MRAIGGILRRGRGGEQPVFAAAFVVGAVNDALSVALRLGPGDARAVSFSKGVVVVGVSHGAVAGTIQQAAETILAQANRKISSAGGSEKTVIKIITRLQPPPLP